MALYCAVCMYQVVFMSSPSVTSDKARQSGAPAPAVQWLTIEPSQSGQRIDNFLISLLKGVPKSRIYRLIRKGELRVNRKRVKAVYRLQSGDMLRIPPLRIAARDTLPQPSAALTSLLQEGLLYEDQDMMVLNKPAGLAVHGGTGVELGLIEALRQIHGAPGLELAHRLDKGTSGCLLVARHQASLRFFSDAFRERRVDKVYHAIVSGTWPVQLTEVKLPLERLPERNGERMVIVSEAGKTALTHFRVLETLGNCTLIEARPETGRTHQIRVHAAHSGHPICGDDKYHLPELAGGRNKRQNRLCLHAAALRLKLPSGEMGEFRAEHDVGFERILVGLRQSVSRA